MFARIKNMVPKNYVWSLHYGLYKSELKIMVLQNYFWILHYGLYILELKLWYRKTIAESYMMVFTDQN
jgi:hypothetical protein